MRPFTLALLLAAPSVQAAGELCQINPALDVAPLGQLAKLEADFGKRLDAVAASCFPQGSRTESKACDKALERCELAKGTLTNEAPWTKVAERAFEEVQAPYGAATYVPRRKSVLSQALADGDCATPEFPSLKRQAAAKQARAGWLKQLQTEYVAYRKWLKQQRPDCLKVEAVREKEAAALAQAVNEKRAVLAAKWKELAAAQAILERDRDFASGFSVSKELADCACEKVNARAVSGQLESQEGGTAAMARLIDTDDVRTACARCGMDAFPNWKQRVTRACESLESLGDEELSAMEKAPESAGIPPRCFEEARAKAKEPPRVDPAPRAPAAPSTREDRRFYVLVSMRNTCQATVEPGSTLARNGDLLLVPKNAADITVKSDCRGIADLYFGKETAPRASETFAKRHPVKFVFRPE